MTALLVVAFALAATAILAAMALTAAWVAATPRHGLAVLDRVELYAASVAMLALLAQAWDMAARHAL